MATPPHLAAQIERARARLAELAEKRRAAFDIGAWDRGAFILGCYNYHHHSENWRHAAEELSALELRARGTKMPERQPETGGA